MDSDGSIARSCGIPSKPDLSGFTLANGEVDVMQDGDRGAILLGKSFTQTGEFDQISHFAPIL